MSQGARNIHALAGTLRRSEREAAEGPCALHPSRPSVGFISGPLGVTPKGCCEACAQYAAANGYTVHQGVAVAPVEWDTIGAKVVGTADSPSAIAQRFDVPEDDVEHELSLAGIETCPICGWWVAASEIRDEGCEGCRG